MRSRCTANAQSEHRREIEMIIKKKVKKISKGYRLKPDTHSLIKEIQEILQVDQDAVITKACRMLYKEMKRKNIVRDS